ncbi:MAG: hypothetical protein GQ475_08180 [Methylococcaceae bacterium]|nr:hypothetical protein [Methylococcaceae bacterium]
MTPSIESKYNPYYSLHCKRLKLKGLQPKTIEAYSRGIRRIAAYFDGHLDDLSQEQLLDYFHDLLDRLSWSTVKLDLYGLKFFYTHVLVRSCDIGVSSKITTLLGFIFLHRPTHRHIVNFKIPAYFRHCIRSR